MMSSCRESFHTFAVVGLFGKTQMGGDRLLQRSGLCFRAMKLCLNSSVTFSFQISSMRRSCRRSPVLAVRFRPISTAVGEIKIPCRRWRCRMKSWRRSRATRKSSTAPASSSTTTAPTSPSTPTGRWWRSERSAPSFAEVRPARKAIQTSLEAQYRLMVADITRDGMYATPRIDSLTEEGATKSRPMKREK